MTAHLHRRPVDRPSDTEPGTVERAMQRALEQRHDGPINVGASVPPDYAEPHHVQMRNRRDGAWQEMRRLGHLIVQERNAFTATHSVTHERERMRLRVNLKFALRNWATFRGMHRAAVADLERRQAEASMNQAKALNGLFGGGKV